MQRYFINKEYKDIQLNEEQIHHIIKVMRMRNGDCFEVVFNNNCYVVELISTLPFEIKIIEKIDQNVELNVDLVLLYCLPKGDKLDLVLQKATEIGVNKIILVQSSRCVSKFKKEDFEKKIKRFNKILIEASEQSHRTNVPEIIDIIDFKDISKYHFDYSFIAYENEKDISLKNELKEVKKGQSIAILIGAEGGFSFQEVEYAISNGFKSISLGKRILRSETACIYALSILSFLVEEI